MFVTASGVKWLLSLIITVTARGWAWLLADFVTARDDSNYWQYLSLLEVSRSCYQYLSQLEVRGEKMLLAAYVAPRNGNDNWQHFSQLEMLVTACPVRQI